ncbi:HtaA domain-containing protein [Leifsonia sp. NPDC080035]|uniref:HtaA domain-containing protein n=1 Tax=Leifsonia sp. NPDC080035 TaxID=3143936 RepID=A0AAU7GGU8_9MICO
MLAAIVAVALGAAGLGIAGAAPALAAGPAVSAPEVPAAGGTITVTGSGFDTSDPGIYLGVGPAGLAGFYQGSASLLAGQTVWVAVGNTEVGSGDQRTSPMTEDGTFSVRLTIPAPTAEVPAYAIYTSKAHGKGFADPSQNTTTALAFAAPEPQATSLTIASSASTVEEGRSVTLTATVAPAVAGTVAFSDGSASLGSAAVVGGVATLSTSALAPGSHSLGAAFTPADASTAAPSTASVITVTVNAASQPAAASVTLSKASGLDAAGADITVTGSGFAPTGGAVMGVYVGVGPASAKDDPSWFVNAGFYQGVKWVRTVAADGSFSQALTGITGVFASNGRTVDCASEECGVYTFAAHGSSDRTQDTYTPIAFAAAQPQPLPVTVGLSVDPATAVEGTTLTYTATISASGEGSGRPTAFPGTVVFGEGSGATAPDTAYGTVNVTGDTAVFRTSTLPVGAHTLRGWYTPADAGAFGAARSDSVTATVTAKAVPGAPHVTVSPASGIDTTAGVITVTGSGFATTGNGVYLGIAPKSVLSDPNWFLNASYFQGAQWISPSGVAGPRIGSDGRFTTTMTGVTASFSSNGKTVDCLTVECGVFTFGAHGSTDRSQDTYTPIAFAAPTAGAVATRLSISVAGSSVQGAPVDVTVTVTPAAAGTVTLYDRGAVVAKDLRLTMPGATASATASAATVTSAAARIPSTLAAATSSSVTTRVPGLAVGSHAFTASFAPDDRSAFAPSVAASVPHTVTAAGASAGPAAPAAAGTAEPVCVARSVDGATLDWGVKASFRSYISGGIANGSWTLNGVGYEGGRYAWSGGSGSFNPTETRGVVRFPGSVAFTGHDGLLNLVLSNIALRVTGADGATLIADVHSTDMSGTPSDFSGVSFATVALGGATASGSTFAVDGAAATLTADGAKAFAGFYTAGTALDPVSFAFPLGAAVACDSSTAAAGSALASTGSDGAGQWPLIVGVLLLTGVAAVLVAQRRRARATAETV